MNNFPFFEHYVAKLFFNNEKDLSVEKIDELINGIISLLHLKVIESCEYRFQNGGLTKVYILSQSHLIIHTWPESKAAHLDLMTCSPNVDYVSFDQFFNRPQIHRFKSHQNSSRGGCINGH